MSDPARGVAAPPAVTGEWEAGMSREAVTRIHTTAMNGERVNRTRILMLCESHESLRTALSERDAECARLRADAERIEYFEERIMDAMGQRFDLVNVKTGALIRVETWGSDSFRSVIDAERAVSDPAGTAPTTGETE